MREECLTVYNCYNFDWKKQAEIDGLEGKNVFVFMYETNSGDVGLNDAPTDNSCIQAKNERN